MKTSTPRRTLIQRSSKSFKLQVIYFQALLAAEIQARGCLGGSGRARMVTQSVAPATVRCCQRSVRMYGLRSEINRKSGSALKEWEVSCRTGTFCERSAMRTQPIMPNATKVTAKPKDPAPLRFLLAVQSAKGADVPWE